ncbi:constitutive coactivator of peroxisome proliferator-activated receptor gamma [Acanthochromis polyacanthus]|uniref:constitutive coactivator of peroxisome proliferator-activated receptor gamma n=1 Tax=Acanthochromis polyacanthus TaxID=80966 RepID=UPI0022341609|nr:constitutive coactivator of peroxisome proliferator-activated receptor gamma [Acanthochromis polyacanthus]XP_022049235.2 constitutive coactivator of peroxisome proliferator-activated receptor gamma [Acanthochromis polyacanthus]
MGVKGLQSFMERCCPETCVTVNLREMARQHAAKSQQSSTTTANTTTPALVVDGMACLRHWYSCKDWVCGGQWKEYMDVLKRWVEAFNSAGIRLVFFFDGVVEEQKRQEWVKRRRRVNGEISKMFRYIKQHGEQPGRELFCLPSGLATFTRFALSSLGQEVYCSVREADYEIANYARQHGSMGILGQDSDFIIYDSAPYLSVTKLWMKGLTTVMYDQQRLCQTLGLSVTQLPLLACLLGNDVVSEERMQHIRNTAMETSRKNNPTPHPGAPQGQVVLAVSQLVSSLWGREEEQTRLVPRSLNLSAPDRELLVRGVCSYLLPGQRPLGLGDVSVLPSAFEKHVSPEILKACREKHVAAEGFMVYSVVCEGVTECSNTLEDEEDADLLPQALVYKPCRQRIYGLLLLRQDGNTVNIPAIKEWFVYPGNPLKEPDMVQPVPVRLPCEQPTLDLLWFSTGPAVSALRLKTFLSIFDCLDISDLHGAIEDSLLAALCLVAYITLQVQTLSQEDVDAYLSQAVCLRLKSPQELQQIELPFLSSRAVQLGSLYIRGLSHLLGANCASGCPLPNAALMPWHSFDGRLFHSKYLLAHNGTENTELLDSNPSYLSTFLQLREKLTETCRKRGRVLQSRPNTPKQSLKTTTGATYRDRHAGRAPGGDEGWRGGRGTTGGHRHERGWRERGEERRDRSQYENRERLWETGGHGGGGGGGQYFHSFQSNYHDGGAQIMNRPPKQSRGRSYHNRGRYQLAPRWQQPPAPGT